MAGWIGLSCLWGITIASYTYLPEIIPVHFNLTGQADAHGSKFVLLFLPVIATLLFIGLTVLNSYPHFFNYPVPITEGNAARQYQNATRMIRTLKLVIVFIFSLCVCLIYRAAKTESGNLAYWFLPVVLAVLLVPMGYYIFRAVKGK